MDLIEGSFIEVINRTISAPYYLKNNSIYIQNAFLLYFIADVMRRIQTMRGTVVPGVNIY